MKKNSGKATISKIIQRDAKIPNDLPEQVVNMLGEHTEGFILFFKRNGRVNVRQDFSNDSTCAVGMQTIAKNYLDAVIDENKDLQRDLITESIDEY